MLSAILGTISNIFKPAADLVDNLHTSDEEKMELQNKLAEMKFQMQAKVMEYETKLMENRAKVVQAEASSSHWLTAAWRPITMLVFVSLIVLRWLGLSAEGISPELEQQLFEIVKIGLGGYIVGRSAEKIVDKYKGE